MGLGEGEIGQKIIFFINASLLFDFIFTMNSYFNTL